MQISGIFSKIKTTIVIGGLIICATLSSAANADIRGNIDVNTYNDNYDYTMTKSSTIVHEYDCNESYDELFNKYGDTEESYCKVKLTDYRTIYCFGLSDTGASAEESLPECANIYCNDPSEYGSVGTYRCRPRSRILRLR